MEFLSTTFTLKYFKCQGLLILKWDKSKQRNFIIFCLFSNRNNKVDLPLTTANKTTMTVTITPVFILSQYKYLTMEQNYNKIILKSSKCLVIYNLGGSFCHDMCFYHGTTGSIFKLIFNGVEHWTGLLRSSSLELMTSIHLIA